MRLLDRRRVGGRAGGMCQTGLPTLVGRIPLLSDHTLTCL